MILGITHVSLSNDYLVLNKLLAKLTQLAVHLTKELTSYWIER